MSKIFNFEKTEITIVHDSFIIDTNVLIGIFKKNDQHHEQAIEFLDAYADSVFYVPVPVIVETWGNLVGRFQEYDSGFEFLDWLQNNNVITIPEACSNIEATNVLMKRMNVDIVDALILDLANNISTICKLNRPIVIATFDTKDFYKLMRLKEFKFSLYDLRTGQFEEFK